MDVAARRNRTLFRWIMVALLAVLMPFAALAQPAAGQADGAEAATATEEAQCRACSYERIGPKVDIGLVALVSLLVVGLLIAASREWGSTSQRWTCRTLALLLVGIGTALLWWAGSVVYLGYNPWQEMAAHRRWLAHLDTAHYLTEVAGGAGVDWFRAFHLEAQRTPAGLAYRLTTERRRRVRPGAACGHQSKRQCTPA